MSSEVRSRLVRSWQDPAYWVMWLAAIFVARMAAGFAAAYRYNVVDDVYISFQYVKNLAAGNGLEFNPGERVEGYTNFLWIVVLTPIYWLSQAIGFDFTTAVIFFNIALAVGDIVLLFLVCQKLFNKQWIFIAFVLILCVLDDSYLVYAMSGFENHLVITLILGAVAVWQYQPKHAPYWTGLLMALAAMTRPDAALIGVSFALAVGSWALLARRKPKRSPKAARPDVKADRKPAKTGRWSKKQQQAVKSTAIAVAAWLCVYGLYFTWRMIYFGYLLPNTFYLKVGGEMTAIPRGLEYLTGFITQRIYLPPLALAAVFFIRQPVVRWVLLYLILHVSYTVYVGGDFYAGHRFLVVLIPICYLLIGMVLFGSMERIRKTSLYQSLASRRSLATGVQAILIVAACLLFFQFYQRGRKEGASVSEIRGWAEKTDNNLKFMKWLRDSFPPHTSMVVGDIGSAGFIANLEVIDVFGIVDPVIAHMEVKDLGVGKPGHEKRGSKDYLLSKNPDLIKWGYIHGDLHGLGFYLHTDFPADLNIHGIWVRDHRDPKGFLSDTQIHFSHRELKSWSKEGTAFAAVPSVGTREGQVAVFGHKGSYINTYAPDLGDEATGTLRSPAIPLIGDIMLLRVGGGRDPERLRVSLLVAGKVVRSATGHNFEILGRREWDISKLKGQTATLEIVDAAEGEWGHLLVDEIVQWSAEQAAQSSD